MNTIGDTRIKTPAKGLLRKVPATFEQQRLWFLDNLQPGNLAYLINWNIRLCGNLDVDALERTLNEIVRRHEVLRTTFEMADGEVMQVVAPAMSLSLPVEDLSRHAIPGEEARRIAQEVTGKPLDLEWGPLVRARLLRLGAREHVLLLTLHHIIFDGTSRRILIRELSALYEAFREGRPSPLPEPKVHYADYAVWQRRTLQGKRYEKLLAYWKTQLADAPAVLALPTDRPRPAVEAFRGAVRHFELPQDSSQKLATLARQQGASLFMVLMGAFQCLLSKYSGQDDILVGTPVAGRTRSELEDLIGYFANQLVVRLRLTGDPSFEEVLAQTKEASFDAFEHQEMPLDRLVHELNPQRSLAHNPLFQVLLSVRNYRKEDLTLAGLDKIEFSANAGEAAKLDLSLYITEGGKQITGWAEFNVDLFDETTIERMLGHYQVLLRAVADDPGIRLSRMPLLPAAERNQILTAWNDTAAVYPQDLCVHQCIELQAHRTPEAVACVADSCSVTYAELNERANQVAHYLRSLGVGRGHRVGLFLERSLQMMIGLVGIQKSGAAYVPLDPAYPTERIALILEDAQVQVLVTQESLASRLDTPAGQIVCLDRDREQISQQRRFDVDGGALPEDTVYVIFTSGSTGRPKGVQVPHRAVVNLLHCMARELQMGPDDVFPALASVSFDMCIPELYLALITGGRIVIGPRHLGADGEALAEFLRANGATIIHATPTTWNLLLQAGFTGKGLKRVIGAEALPQDLCRRLLQADPSLYNYYGPTETTVWSAMHHFQNPEEPVVIGRPLTNTQIYILDKTRRPVPIGVLGEIYIAGMGVAHGYLNRPELTAEKFLDDPFGVPGARMYRTGDLGRYLADGRIEFSGRADHQIKLRGYRIELGEIETVLGRHPAVRECVVVAREDVPGDKRLVGYVVASGEGDATPAQLRAWVKEYLPDYMAPVAIVKLEKFPLTPNGKVDRGHLPAPAYRRSDLDGRYIAPRTPAQEIISGIWSSVLKLDRVGVEDDFFALGGHSLLGTQVISRIRDAFHAELPLRALFESPTVAGLAERTENLRNRPEADAPALRPDRRQDPARLSFAQERLWFLDQLEPGNPLYNVPLVLRVHGPLQLTALEDGLNAIVQRHETLRTRFEAVNGKPGQLIDPQSRVALAVTDLGALPREARESEARRLAEEERVRPFDLRRAPLLRAAVIVLSPDDHVMVLNLHHIVSDAWSLEILMRELEAAYSAQLDGRCWTPEELPVQYADCAEWQRESMSGPALERQLAYWKGQLAGAPLVLTLPTDRPRPPAQDFRGAQQQVIFSKELLEALTRLSRQENATLYMTLLAALSVMLSRYTGRNDIVVGSPIAGRNRVAFEKLIGLFVNTLVMRNNLEDDPTFREFLCQVRETALDAYAHQDLPFEKIVETLRPDRSLSHNPLFQVMFSLQPAGHSGLAGLKTEPFPAALQTAKVDLTLLASEQPEGLRLAVQYQTALFDDSTIGRMLEHFRTLLEGIAAYPDTRVSELPLLPAGEKQRLLVAWNDTARQYPCHLTLHGWFEQQAARTPDATAIVFGDDQLTYRELNQRSDRLAGYLRASGVGFEILTGICLERSLEMMVALLGVLKAGGAYVPLDPAYPRERLAHILEDSRAPVVVTQSSLLADLPSFTGQTICIDADWPKIAAHPATNRQPEVVPGQLAYVLYTSGSTGKPKGVQITHENVVNFLASMQATPGIGEGDTLLAVTTLSFDIAGLELYLPLVSGAKVVVASREEASDGTKLRALLERSRATVLQATPATWWMLLEAGWTGSPALKALCGGEALPADLAKRLVPCCRELWNMYGPTETTIWSSVCRIDESNTGRITIGRPIANTTMYVLDAQLRPVPIGLTAELYIGGDGVGRGYWDRPDLTAEKFLTDPFNPHARMYRTGDLAKFLPDGSIQYLGRSDFQVKVRGFRIELGEIETILGQHPAVTKCVVAAREDEPGDTRLVAYVVAAQDQVAQASELRTWLKERLPDYMVPAAIVRLEQFPLTANGKVDRRNLPAPDYRREAEGQTYRAPRSPVEEVAATMWAQLLKLASVGIEDNFFELGGHSLLGTQVISRIREAFGVEVPLRALFEAPTVSGLAKRIEALQREKQGVVVPPLRRVPHDGPLPLSFAQERLWLLDQLEPGSPLYNVSRLMHLRGELCVAALESAFREILRRHEVLRTTIRSVDGRPEPAVRSECELAVPVNDLSNLAEEEREMEVRRLAAGEALRPFDLANGPLLRVLLLRLSADAHMIVVTMHHIVTDRWSLSILWGELAVHYRAFLEGKPASLPELAVQYADFAVWQREWLRAELLESGTAYWKQKMAGAPPLLELPTDRPRPPVASHRGAALTRELHRPLMDKLRSFGRAEGTTLFMTLLAGFKTLLSKYSGQEDIVVGSVVAGRTHAAIEPLMGFFVNTIPLRTDLSGDPTFRALVARVKDVALDAYAHQDLPFEKLVEELSPERSLSYDPVFQVAFLQDQATQALNLPGLCVEPRALPGGTAVFDTTWYVVEHAEGIRLYVDYKTDLFDQSTIERMVGNYCALLEAVGADPDLRLAELPLLTTEEEHQLLVEWNNTTVEYARNVCAHELFEEQAARTPDNLAVSSGDRSLSYADLNRQSNQLAHRLSALGVGPETIVGVCLERSIELVVAIVAVVKAGGAYLPLDPSYPAERLRFMLDDSGVHTVLTRSGLAPDLPHTALRIQLDTDWPMISEEAGEKLPRLANAANLAYVIYTSGSTGRPKGVEIEHRSLVNLIAWHRCEYDVQPHDRATLIAAPAFDASVWELWPHLAAGASLHIPDEEIRSSPVSLLGWLQREGITLTFLPTPLAESVLDALDGTTARLRLRALLTGGATLHRRPDAALPFRLANHYGPTECTVVTTWTPVSPGKVGVPPIGKPISNTRVYILDPRLRPVPVGVAGEIYIGGDGLARGYRGGHELTAQKFIRDPFSEGRLYRTGDRARYLADGNIEFLGRLDHQVKLRGFRIELGEIEAVLRRHTSVQECVVVLREDGGGDPRLVAYVVPCGSKPVDTELRGLLQRQLPEYMVPAIFVELDSMPLTPNGKIDRKSLPAPSLKSSNGSDSASPGTPAEELLASIWADVLRTDRVELEDNFFELGGHSLAAAQVVSRVRTAFGVELPLRALFETPTLSALARRIDEAQRKERGLLPPPIVPVPRVAGLPLSFAQQRLWILDRLEPDNPLYNVPRALRMKGELNLAAMEQALNGLVSRHEALRTTYSMESGQPIQVIHEAMRIDLPVVDLSTLDAPRRDEEAARVLNEHAHRPFHLATDLMLRAVLLKMDLDDHILFLNTHHIASDGWSSSVMLRDLTALYQAALEQTPPNLPALPVQYADYSVWQRKWLSGQILENQLAFWRDRLDGAPPLLALPTDRPRPPLQTFRGAQQTRELSDELAAAIRRAGRHKGSTPFMTMLAAFQSLIFYYTRQPDVVVGTDIAGRDNAQTEALIGFFVNLLVMRTDLSGDPTFDEILDRAREVALSAYTHRDVPFDKLVEELHPERSLSHNPLVQVLLVHQKRPPTAFHMPGVEISGYRLPLSSKFDMALFVTEIDTRISTLWLYNPDLFDPATVSHMAALYQTVLATATADSQITLSGLMKVLAEAEEQQLALEREKLHAASLQVWRSIKRKTPVKA